jgi:hypothetical protein
VKINAGRKTGFQAKQAKNEKEAQFIDLGRMPGAFHKFILGKSVGRPKAVPAARWDEDNPSAGAARGVRASSVG